MADDIIIIDIDTLEQQIAEAEKTLKRLKLELEVLRMKKYTQDVKKGIRGGLSDGAQFEHGIYDHERYGYDW